VLLSDILNTRSPMMYSQRHELDLANAIQESLREIRGGTGKLNNVDVDLRFEFLAVLSFRS